MHACCIIHTDTSGSISWYAALCLATLLYEEYYVPVIKMLRFELSTVNILIRGSVTGQRAGMGDTLRSLIAQSLSLSVEHMALQR